MSIKTLTTLVLLLLLEEVTAQDAKPERKFANSYYAYLGYGWGGQKTANNLGLAAQISAQTLLAADISFTRKAATEGDLFISQVSPVKQTTSISYSLLYGRIVKYNWGMITLMAGPSYVIATTYETPDAFNPSYYSGVDEKSIGLALNAGIIAAKKFGGLGMNAFLNLNNAYTYGGLTFNVVLGKVHFKAK